jgi:thiamine kinase-like enzyme
MTEIQLPTEPHELSLDMLNMVIGAYRGNVALTGFEVTESHVWGGGQASSAGRIIIRPDYAAGAPQGLPGHIVIKVAKTPPGASGDGKAGGSGPLYANEVNVYTRLQPASFLEAPQALGGAYDPRTNTMMLLIEDMRDRGGSFPNVLTPTSTQRMHSLLDQLARLHARYWNSPAFGRELNWMEAHTRGSLHVLFNTPEAAPRFIAHQVQTEQFKREMVERLGTDTDGLFRQFQAVQRHQAGLPQTVCHGDTHIANTYILPGDTGGLLDWQLCCQGFAMHDVSYLLATGLSVAERRAQERELLAWYREHLLAHGAPADAVPDAGTLWDEYRRAMVWGVYIGWLTTPVVNYGWEITVMNHLRVMTAYEDLETGRLIDALG